MFGTPTSVTRSEEPGKAKCQLAISVPMYFTLEEPLSANCHSAVGPASMFIENPDYISSYCRPHLPNANFTVNRRRHCISIMMGVRASVGLMEQYESC